MTGSAESYFSAFAILLKATTAQVGLVASLPPLLASFMQLFSAWLGRRTGHRRQIIVFGALVQASTLVPLTLLPLLFPDDAVLLLLISSIVYYAGPNLGSPQWSSLMGDIVPEARRGRFFALRTQLASVASFLALIAGGLILEFFDSIGRDVLGFRRGVRDRVSRALSVGVSPVADPRPAGTRCVARIAVAHRSVARDPFHRPRAVLAVLREHAVRRGHRVAVLHAVHAARSEVQLCAVHDQLRGIGAVAVPHAEPVGPPQRSVRKPADPDHHRRDHPDHAHAVAVFDELLLPARRAMRERAGVGRVQPERVELRLRPDAAGTPRHVDGCAQRARRTRRVRRRSHRRLPRHAPSQRNHSVRQYVQLAERAVRRVSAVGLHAACSSRSGSCRGCAKCDRFGRCR